MSNPWNNIENEFQLYANMLGIQEALIELNEVMEIDITSTIRSMSSGIDVVKKLADLALKTKNIELQEGVLNLREKLLEAKEALLNAKEEISVYKEKEAENQQKIKILETEIEKLKNPDYRVVWKDNFYYKENEEEKYCSGCYDSKKELIRVVRKASNIAAKIHECPVCKTEYKEYDKNNQKQNSSEKPPGLAF